jgi:hypothetical protein
VTGAVVYAAGPRLAPEQPWDLWAFLTGAGILVLVSFATAASDPPKQLRDAEGRTLEYRDRLGVLR